MKRLFAVVSAGLAACGGGQQPPPQTTPETAGAVPTGPAPTTPLRYRLRDPIHYEVVRHDTLIYRSMPGAPETSSKRAVVSVRQASGRSDIELTVDSVVALPGTRLTSGAVDSATGARWVASLFPSGIRGSLSGPRGGVLSGQMEAALRLLLPQLPPNGVRVGDTWADSSIYRSKMDAFDATESASRTSRAESGSGAGVTVEATEALTRHGTATQGGQTMAIRGGGLRTITYVFSPEGWVSSVSARDSLELVVTVTPAGQSIPVMWRSTVFAQVRGTSPH